MPRAGPTTPDERGIDLFHEWISSLAQPDGSGDADVASHEDAVILQRLRDAESAATTSLAATIEEILASTRGAMILSRFVTQEACSKPLRREIISVAASTPSSNVRDLFERFLPPSQRVKRLGNDIRPDTILSLEGDAERGRKAFQSGIATQCKTCHRVDGEGGLVGPDLREAGKKQARDTLLESILYPSRKVEEKFATLTVVTTTGQVLTGILAEKTDETVVLRDAKGEVLRVPTAEVAAFEPDSQSLMPERLLREWTAQQAADVLEYLAGQDSGGD